MWTYSYPYVGREGSRGYIYLQVDLRVFFHYRRTLLPDLIVTPSKIVDYFVRMRLYFVAEIFVAEIARNELVSTIPRNLCIHGTLLIQYVTVVEFSKKKGIPS